MTHTPVLLNEVIEYLNIKPGGVIFDGTLGAGGHSRAIMERLGAEGILVGVDCDDYAIKIAKDNLGGYGDRVKIYKGNYADIQKILNEAGLDKVDGVLLDLGASSMQLSSQERGFSFQSEGALDMRMDRSNPLTAEIVVNTYPEEELEEIFRNYGEERYTRRIVRNILRKRSIKPFKTTLELADAVRFSVPFNKKSRIHPATRVFQALRIHVNDELENLGNAVRNIPRSLKAAGRLVIISFHSLEDRIVKHSFIDMRRENVCAIITPKPVTASPGEIQDNYNSRSAKMRVAEKI